MLYNYPLKRCWFFFLISFLTYSQTNQPPVITTNSRQAYCPQSQIRIAPNFTITDPDDTGIDAFYIQISSGYIINEDRLVLTGNHPNVISYWSDIEGRLTLTSNSASGAQVLYTYLQAAVRDVIFKSSNPSVAGEKFFSFTIGDVNFLPSNGHFYEYVSNEGIDWESARQAAAGRTYFGLQGYLATVTSQDEAQLVGNQVSGAGWIGGSDAAVEGVWRWVTGPETGQIFWNGNFNGSSPTFSFWNTGEPNNNGDEDYAHVTDPSIGISGSWNDLPLFGTSGLYLPKGYVVEYGGMAGDPTISVSASTSIYIPRVTSSAGGNICISGTVTLTATVSDGNALWYDARTGGTLLATGNSFVTPTLTSSTIYYLTVSVNGCLSIPRIPVSVNVNQEPLITSTTDDLICTGQRGSITAAASTGNIFWYNSPSSTRSIATGTNYTTPALTSTTIYYVEANVSGCTSSRRIPVTVTVDNTLPMFDVPVQVVLCINQASVDITAANPQGNYTYEWRDEQRNIIGSSATVSVTQTGIYTVIGTSLAGCISEEKRIVVTASELANFGPDNLIINDSTNNNAIQILAENLGIGSYEFSIDNNTGPYSTVTSFSGLTPGVHTLFIRDTKGCGIFSYRFALLNYPEFFTPNDDGVNDVWWLEGIDRNFYTQSEIKIFNRFGLIVGNLNASSIGWNGRYGGKLLPSSDYWFSIKLVDINGVIVEKKGHFSLLRR